MLDETIIPRIAATDTAAPTVSAPTAPVQQNAPTPAVTRIPMGAKPAATRPTPSTNLSAPTGGGYKRVVPDIEDQSAQERAWLSETNTLHAQGKENKVYSKANDLTLAIESARDEFGYTPEEAQQHVLGDPEYARQLKNHRKSVERADRYHAVFSSAETSDIAPYFHTNIYRTILGYNPNGGEIRVEGALELRHRLEGQIESAPRKEDAPKIIGAFYQELANSQSNDSIPGEQRRMNFQFMKMMAGEVVINEINNHPADKDGKGGWESFSMEKKKELAAAALTRAGIDPAIALKQHDIGEQFSEYGQNKLQTVISLAPGFNAYFGDESEADKATIMQAGVAVESGMADKYQIEVARASSAMSVIDELRGNTVAADVTKGVQNIIPFLVEIAASGGLTVAARATAGRTTAKFALEKGVQIGLRKTTNRAIARTAAVGVKMGISGAAWAAYKSAPIVARATTKAYINSALVDKNGKFDDAVFSHAFKDAAKETAKEGVMGATFELNEPLEFLVKGFFKTAFRYAGKALPAGALAAAKKTAALVSQYNKATANTLVSRAAKQAIFVKNPLVGMASMQIGSAVNGIFGLEKYHMPTGRDLVVEFLTFLIPDVAKHGANLSVYGLSRVKARVPKTKTIKADRVKANLDALLMDGGAGTLGDIKNIPVDPDGGSTTRRRAQFDFIKSRLGADAFESPEGIGAGMIVAPELFAGMENPMTPASRKNMPGVPDAETRDKIKAGVTEIAADPVLVDALAGAAEALDVALKEDMAPAPEPKVEPTVAPEEVKAEEVLPPISVDDMVEFFKDRKGRKIPTKVDDGSKSFREAREKLKKALNTPATQSERDAAKSQYQDALDAFYEEKAPVEPAPETKARGKGIYTNKYTGKQMIGEPHPTNKDIIWDYNGNPKLMADYTRTGEITKLAPGQTVSIPGYAETGTIISESGGQYEVAMSSGRRMSAPVDGVIPTGEIVAANAEPKKEMKPTEPKEAQDAGENNGGTGSGTRETGQGEGGGKPVSEPGVAAGDGKESAGGTGTPAGGREAGGNAETNKPDRNESNADAPKVTERDGGKADGQGRSGKQPDLSPGEVGAGTESGAEAGAGVKAPDIANDPNKAPERPKAPEFKPDDKGGTDTVLTDEDRIGEGGAVTKIKANLAAIRLLKELNASGRKATPAEQKILARYIGWGMFPGVFFDVEGGGVKKDMMSYAEELRDILTKSELDAARRSTLNAHYTSPEVIKGIWDGISAMGFKGGSVLEPSVGLGNFFGFMPQDLRALSNLHGVELDALTAGMVKQVYQNAQIEHLGFEQASTPMDSKDLIVGNIPFGNYPVSAANYDLARLMPSSERVHDFFISKAMLHLKPGGLLVLITSSGSLDKVGTESRKFWASNEGGRGEFVGAIRLPENAFKSNAGTSVVTDILVFKKRAPGAESKSPIAFINTMPMELNELTHPVNEYFYAHPENVLGVHDAKMSQNGMKYTVTPVREADLQSGIATAMREFAKVETAAPTDWISPQEASAVEQGRFIESSLHPEVRDGYMAVLNGKVYIREGERLREVEFDAKTMPDALRIIPAVDKINAAYEKLISEQRRIGATEKEVEAARVKLNDEYDQFAGDAGAGIFNNQRFHKVMGEDARFFNMLALEKEAGKEKTTLKTGKESKRAVTKWEKEDIFFNRTETPRAPRETAASAKEALMVTLSDKAAVDMPNILKLLEGRRTEEQVYHDLDGLILWDGATNSYISRDVMLSGDILKKIEDNTNALKRSDDPRIKDTLAALEQAKPARVPASQVEVEIGANWVPIEYYRRFLYEVVKVNNPQISFLKADGSWNFETSKKSGANSIPWGVRDEIGTDDISGPKLFAFALSKKAPVIKDSDGVIDEKRTAQAKAAMITLQRKFSNWLLDPRINEARSENVVDLYNKLVNRYAEDKFDGTHLELVGSNPNISLKGSRSYSINAVWRFLTTGNMLLAHTVGAGKTFVIAACIMEGLRLNRFKRVMVTMPNHLVGSFGTHFRELYPSAKILTLTSDQVSSLSRKTLLARLNSSGCNVIVVSSQTFAKIPMPQEFQRSYIEEQITDLRIQMTKIAKEKGDKNSIKNIEEAIIRLEKRLDELGKKWKKDTGGLDFAQAGIDALFVDESHSYKNLFFTSSMPREVRGVGANSDVGMSNDMHMKTEYLNRRYGERNILFATGTPISNSVSELYSLKRYLIPSVLDRLGVRAFDSWVTMFGKINEEPSIDTTGSGMQIKSALNEYKNMAALKRLFMSFADVVNDKDLEIISIKNLAEAERTGKKPEGYTRPVLFGNASIPVKLNPTAEHEAYTQEIIARIDNIKGRKVKPDEDNMLKVFTDVMKAALSMRLVNPNADTSSDVKIMAVADNVMRHYKETAGDKGTQIIWGNLYRAKEGMEVEKLPGEGDASSDTSSASEPDMGEIAAPTTKGEYNWHYAMRDELVSRGIPKEQIAFIGDCHNVDQKKALLAKVKSGEVRILTGTTRLMGTGMNVQDRIIAMHNADCNLTPDGMAQRLGRMLRQGNMWRTVFNYNYVLQGTGDAVLWQFQEKKARYIEQILRKPYPGEVFTGMPSVADQASLMKAAASGNPRILELHEKQTRIKYLSALQGGIMDSLETARKDAAAWPKRIENMKAERANFLEAATFVADKMEAATTIDEKGNKTPNLTFETVNGLKGPSVTISGRDKIAEEIEKKRKLFSESMRQEDVIGRMFDSNISFSSVRGKNRSTGESEISVFARIAVGEGAKRAEFEFELGDSADGNVARILNAFKSFEAKANIRANEIAAAEVKLDNAKKGLDQKFEEEEELNRLINEAEAIKQELLAAQKAKSQPAKTGGKKSVDTEVDEYGDGESEYASLLASTGIGGTSSINPKMNPLLDDRAVVGGGAGQQYGFERNMKSPGARIPASELMSAPDIIHKMKQLFDVKMFAGKSRMRKAAAVYSPGEDVITTLKRITGDLGVAVHEIFHSVDRNWGTVDAKGNLVDLTQTLSPAMKAELVKLDYEPEKKRVHEGFAEFFRILLTKDEAEARRAAPLTAAYMDKWLQEKENAPIAEAVESTRMMIDRYINTYGAMDVVRAAVKNKQGGIMGDLAEVKRDGIRNSLKDAPSAAYAVFFDGLNRIKQFDEAAGFKPGRGLGTTAKDIADIQRGKSSVFTQDWMKNGVETVIERNGKATPARMPSRANILDVVKGLSENELADYGAYLFADQLTETIPQGHEAAGITYQEAARAVRDFERENPSFPRRAAIHRSYFRDLVMVQVDAGLISVEEANAIVGKFKKYTPLQRDILTKTGLDKYIKSGGQGTAWHKRSKTGSGENILDIMQVTYKETQRVVNRVMANNIQTQIMAEYRAAAASGNAEHLGAFVRELPYEWVQEHINTRQAVELLIEAGVHPDSFDDIRMEVTMPDGSKVMQYAPDKLSYWKQDWGAYDQYSNVIMVRDFTGGKPPKFYAIDKSLLDCAMGGNDFSVGRLLHIEKQHPLVRAAFKFGAGTLGFTAKAIRLGAVTVNPAFAATHFANCYTAFLFNSHKLNDSNGKPLPLYKAAVGPFMMLPIAVEGEVREALGMNQRNALFMQAQKGGIKLSSMHGGDINQSANSFIAAMTVEGDRSGRIKQLAKSPKQAAGALIGAVSSVVAISDVMTRLYVMQKSYESQGITMKDLAERAKQGISPPQLETRRALWAAQDYAINFGRMGWLDHTFNFMHPFYSAHLAAIDNMGRVVSSARKDGKWNSRAIEGMGVILALAAAATALYWYAKRDKDWSKQSPLWQRNRGFFVMEGANGAPMVEIPRGKGAIGMWSHFIEGCLDSANQKDLAPIMEALKTGAKEGLPSIPTPSLLSIYNSIEANKDSQTGAPIISPFSQVPQAPWIEKTEKTTSESKWLASTMLGKWLGVSPPKADYLFNNITGGAYMKLAGEKQNHLRDFIPLVAYDMHTKAPTEFYAEVSKMDTAKAIAKAENRKIEISEVAKNYRLNFYAEVMGVLREQINATSDREEMGELKRYQTGVALAGLREAPLALYPNPIIPGAAPGAPVAVIEGIEKIIASKVTTALSSPQGSSLKMMMKKADKQDMVAREQADKDAAIEVLRETGMTTNQIFEIWAKNHPEASRTTSAATYKGLDALQLKK